MMLGVNDYLVIDRTQWMQNWPGQIVLNGSQVGGEDRNNVITSTSISWVRRTRGIGVTIFNC